MPNSLDILKEKTLSNGQAIGLIVAMFAIFEFYYNGNRTTEMFDTFIVDEKQHREEVQDEFAEQKGLTYRLVREGNESVNARIDRKVDPLRNEVKELLIWKAQQEGYAKGLRRS